MWPYEYLCLAVTVRIITWRDHLNIADTKFLVIFYANGWISSTLQLCTSCLTWSRIQCSNAFTRWSIVVTKNFWPSTFAVEHVSFYSLFLTSFEVHAISAIKSQFSILVTIAFHALRSLLPDRLLNFLELQFISMEYKKIMSTFITELIRVS